MAAINELKKIFRLDYSKARGQGINSASELKMAFDDLTSCIRNLNNKNDISVELSCGIGRWATVPWIRLYYSNYSPSAKKGLYIVYLFSNDGKKVFLTLNQGTTNSTEEERYFVKNHISSKIDKKSFNLNTNTLQIGDDKNYGSAAIFYKVYSADALPNEDTFIKDLHEITDIYEECKNNNLMTIFKNELPLDTENSMTDTHDNEIIKKFSIDNFDNSIFIKRYAKSLLSKPFTILAGNSGTGKTKIAKDFAIWLGKPNPQDSKDIQNKLIVPVGADWTDNTKILGFYNPLKKTYESTKILDFILRAGKKENENIPFFLILDEMNLSHVERYFSDFLSAMESHEKIILYSKDDECDSDIPDTIDLPENLFVTGTVNIDETTYMFSPKVLDRANVIEFIPEQSKVLGNFENETQPDPIVPANDGSAEGFLALAKTVRDKKDLPDKEKSKKCIEILTDISAILEGSGFEFAFRTAKEIRLYINAAYMLAENEGKSLEEKKYINLMDEQLLQKILPKIHGNRCQVGTLLKNLSDFCDSKTVKIKIDGIDTDISGYDLSKSKKKLDKMIKQLEASQFTSFI